MKCGYGRTDSSVGMRGVFRLSIKPKRFLRPLISVIVAYAVAAQSLLIIALGGSSVPANVGDDAPAFELCLHNAQDATELPAGNPDHTYCTDCIFCFAGSHHAAIGMAPIGFHRVNVAMVVVPWRGGASGPRRLTRHTIASPRGPPFSV